MTIQIELRPEIVARLTSQARARGVEVPTYVESLIEEAVATSTLTSPRPRTPEEIQAWLDELAQFSDEIPAMPGETFTRAMIYPDHDCNGDRVLPGGQQRSVAAGFAG